MRVIRILVVVLAVAEVAFWSVALLALGQWGHATAGMSAGRVPSESTGDTLFAAVLWLLLASPYICIALGALNLITGRSRRVACVYSLVILSIMTLILLMTFLRTLEIIALGNIVLGGLWLFSFRGMVDEQTEPTEPPTPV